MKRVLPVRIAGTTARDNLVANRRHLTLNLFIICLKVHEKNLHINNLTSYIACQAVRQCSLYLFLSRTVKECM